MVKGSDNMQDFSDAPRIVDKFLSYKDTTQNRSKKTVFQYYHDLRTFARFLLLKYNKDKYSEVEFGDISFSDADDDLLINAKREDIYDFMSFCSRTLENGVSARHRKLSCLSLPGDLHPDLGTPGSQVATILGRISFRKTHP